MKNAIVKRNVLFWGKYGVQLTGILLGFTVLYGFLFNMGGDIGKFWETAHFYGLIIGILFAYTGASSYSGVYIPMVISFGSGRKEALWGAQLRNAAYIVSAYMVVLFTEYMNSGSLSVTKDILIFEGMVLFSAVGQFCMAAQLHFGQKGMIASVVFIAVVVAVGTFVGLMQIEDLANAWSSASQNSMGIFLAAGALVTVIGYGISILVAFRVMKRYEMKA